MKKPTRTVDDGTTVIFRRWRRDPRTGRMLDARHYGLAAWPIRVPVNPAQGKLF